MKGRDVYMGYRNALLRETRMRLSDALVRESSRRHEVEANLLKRLHDIGMV